MASKIERIKIIILHLIFGRRKQIILLPTNASINGMKFRTNSV